MDRSIILQKCGLTETAFTESGISWEELAAIRNDYDRRAVHLAHLGTAIASILQEVDAVYATRTALRAGDDLIAEIILRRLESSQRPVTVATYFSSFSDLVRVQALCLSMDSWETIHRSICQIWRQSSAPQARIRSGDPAQMRPRFESGGCSVVVGSGYSVEYQIGGDFFSKGISVSVGVSDVYDAALDKLQAMLDVEPPQVSRQVSESILALRRLSGAAQELCGQIYAVKRKNQAAAAGPESGTIHDAMQRLDGVVARLDLSENDRSALVAAISNLKSCAVSSPAPLVKQRPRELSIAPKKSPITAAKQASGERMPIGSAGPASSPYLEVDVSLAGEQKRAGQTTGDAERTAYIPIESLGAAPPPAKPAKAGIGNDTSPTEVFLEDDIAATVFIPREKMPRSMKKKDTKPDA